jgi:hypothetical protein
MPAQKRPSSNKKTEKTQTAQSQKTNTLSIIAIVLTFLLFTIPIVGLILGIVALVQLKKKNEGGKGLAIASIVISSIFIVLQIIFLIAIVSLANFGEGLVNGNRSLNFNQNGNSISIGGNVALPSGFPNDVPIYPGSKLKLATKSEKGEFTVTLTTPDSQEKVSSYYKEQMTSKGWVSENEEALGEIGQMNGLGSFTKDSQKTNLAVLQNKENSTTTVFITVSKVNNETY